MRQFKCLLKVGTIKSLEVEIRGTVEMILFHVVDDLTVDCILGRPWRHEQ